MVNEQRKDDGLRMGESDPTESAAGSANSRRIAAEFRGSEEDELPTVIVSEVDGVDSGTQAPTHAPDSDDGIVTPPPLRVGTYRLLGVLGEGAMGVVYRAEQERPRREVALKVLKAGTASPAAMDRFEQETQVLGRLQHPGIAQIFEAGTADTGYGPQPFFAMEFVHGEPLKNYADARRLNTTQRLRLMIAVCDGIQHAHQKGVIHRDLKPGNILVDETGQPKILDFGIALLSRDDETATATRDGKCHFAGTPPYMSPEQLSGNAHELDTRSDVYALGVVAYQLLSGRLPFDLRDKTAQEAVQLVRTHRPTPLGTLAHDCSGDIEAIVDKALAPGKASRYASASDLAADIQRYFQHEPVLAHSRTGGYLLRKFVRRHRALVASACFVFFAMSAALWWTNKARTKAEEEAETKNRVTKLALSIVDAVAPKLDPGESPASRMQTILDESVQELAKEDFSKRPAVEGELRSALGKIYRTFGDYDKSLFQLESATKILKKTLGPTADETLQVMQEMALSLKADGKIREAELLYREALAAQRAVLGTHDKMTLETLQNLALLCQDQGKPREADELFEEARTAIIKAYPNDHELLQGLLSNQAFLLKKRGESDAARKANETVLAKYRESLPENHPHVLITKANLAEIHLQQGEYAAAHELFVQIIDEGQRVLGEGHATILAAMSSLAGVLRKQGKTKEARELFERTYDARRRHLGDDHPKTLVTMHNLASLLMHDGDLAQAEELLKRVWDRREARFGPNHPEVLSTMNSLASILKNEGKLAESAALYEDVITGYEKIDSRDTQTLELARYNLAVVLQDEIRDRPDALKSEKAERAYRQSINYFRERYGREHPTPVTMTFSLATLFSDRGDFRAAAELYEEVLSLQKRKWPGRVSDIARSQFHLGEAMLALNRLDEAERTLRDCIATRLRKLDPHDFRVANAENALGGVLAARGLYNEAEAILLRTLPIIESHYKPGGKRTREALSRLIGLYQEWDKPEKAAVFASRLSQFD